MQNKSKQSKEGCRGLFSLRVHLLAQSSRSSDLPQQPGDGNGSKQSEALCCKKRMVQPTHLSSDEKVQQIEVLVMFGLQVEHDSCLKDIDL